jgi:hypothetical protein
MDTHGDEYLNKCLRKCQTLSGGGIKIPVSRMKAAAHVFWTAAFTAFSVFVFSLLFSYGMAAFWLVLLAISSPFLLGFLWRLITGIPMAGVTINDGGITVKPGKLIPWKEIVGIDSMAGANIDVGGVTLAAGEYWRGMTVKAGGIVPWELIDETGTRQQEVTLEAMITYSKKTSLWEIGAVALVWAWTRGEVIPLIRRESNMEITAVAVNPLFLKPAATETDYILWSMIKMKKPHLFPVIAAAPDDKNQKYEVFEVKKPSSSPVVASALDDKNQEYKVFEVKTPSSSPVAATPDDAAPDDVISRAKSRILGDLPSIW